MGVEQTDKILILAGAVLLCLLLLLWRRKRSGKQATAKKRKGNRRPGYNRAGRNRDGKYNRYYDVACYRTKKYSKEGFLDIREHPLYLTNHARERMRQRMGITEDRKMDALARRAYQFGKSKLQLPKTEGAMVKEKEKKYGDSVILLYGGFWYVFTPNNGLKTVYQKEKR